MQNKEDKMEDVEQEDESLNENKDVDDKESF